ncbi:hypothetical protein ABZV67_05560 [Streptomyces sp. NPDC005065]|uniref:hypothetical protein n=1 Tax=unclassified Streptomyces TaxID=2593676 RepID=UPI0033BB1D76
MTGWHVGARLARRYASGTAAETEAWSLEKHVEACEGCAARVSAAVRGQGAAAAVVDEVRAAVVAAAGQTDRAEAARESVAARGSTRVPASPPPSAPRHYRAPLLAPALRAAGPALRGPWLASVLLMAAAAVALAYGARSGTGAVAGLPARQLLLLIAPVLPLAGVGVAYGRHADPVYELAASTPSGGLRLLLIRTAAVLGLSVPLLTAAGAVLPASAGAPGAVAWLLPAVAMTLAALALGSYTGCRTGASSVTAAWALAVVVPSAGAPLGPEALADGAARYLAGPFAQSGWAAGALLCAALLAVRRRSFDHLEKL